MIQIKNHRLAGYIAPGFLMALVAVFLIAPWSLKAKLDGVCFGI